LIKALATDANGFVFLAEWQPDQSKYLVSTYNGDGELKYSIEYAIRPAAIVASPTMFYVAEDETSGRVLLYKPRSGDPRGTLKKPEHCDKPYKLAIMQPSS
jgi:hypothetical protein